MRAAKRPEVGVRPLAAGRLGVPPPACGGRRAISQRPTTMRPVHGPRRSRAFQSATSPHPGDKLLEFAYRIRDTHARKMRSEQT
jgi:hypothetical protein